MYVPEKSINICVIIFKSRKIEKKKKNNKIVGKISLCKKKKEFILKFKVLAPSINPNVEKMYENFLVSLLSSLNKFMHVFLLGLERSLKILDRKTGSISVK